MKTPVSTMTLALVAALAAACGEDSTHDPDQPSEPIEPVFRELATAVCALTFACCSRGEMDFYSGPFVVEEDCADRLVAEASVATTSWFGVSALPSSRIQLPNIHVLQRAIDEGRVTVDRNAVDACLAHLGPIDCAPLPDDAPLGCVAPEVAQPSPCQAKLMFAGQLEAGERCTSVGSAIECEGDLVCRSFGGIGEGVCVQPGEIGDVCFSSAGCSAELHCSQFDGTCQMRSVEGEICLYADPNDPSPPVQTLLIECEAGLSCDPLTETCVVPCQRGATCANDTNCDTDAGLSCIVGRCELAGDLGAPCSSDTHCADGLRCEPNPVDPATLVCTTKLRDFEACMAFFGGHEDCASGYCDGTISQCLPSSSPGASCPSGDFAQCGNGWCETSWLGCTDNAECAGSGVCNIPFGRCEYYCVAESADGEACTFSAQCASASCVAGFCASLPLADGLDCTSDFQCGSSFCNFDLPRVCESLPLADASPCSSGFQCESGVCYDGVCNTGRQVGDVCGGGGPGCANQLYCDPVSARCDRFLEIGEECLGNYQCRGSCIIRFGRNLCDATPDPDTAICDGR